MDYANVFEIIIKKYFTERNILQSPFTDQSHAVFYCSANALPSTQFRVSSFRPRNLLMLTSARDMADGTCSARTLPSTEHTSLKKELAELKLLVKQKEKELKAAKKEEKKKMKVGLKERKKVVKAKSSGDRCESTRMRMVRSWQPVLGITGEVGTSLVPLQGLSTLASKSDHQVSGSVSLCGVSGAVVSPVRTDEHGLGQIVTSDELLDEHEKEVSGKVMLKGRLESIKSPVESFTCPLRADQSPNRIEDCVGGKCKKAGSDLLLQELRSHVPNGCNVEAVPCKCMGTMLNAHKHEGLQGGSMAVPQQHSHVGVDDAKFILASHFGFAPSPSARPSLPVASGWTLLSWSMLLRTNARTCLTCNCAHSYNIHIRYVLDCPTVYSAPREEAKLLHLSDKLCCHPPNKHLIKGDKYISHA
ncbi:hypothetical protein KP509_24G051700 [Ceratopteris richardii]|uniref:Uncharacterized protein n=1 Tax=Ceratopteris richardii TaxID=49495 RepID=A0A8T2RXE4_CERRI|nr:hypothetical protein KP509_24G051700 [Ceratopteris richardii]